MGVTSSVLIETVLATPAVQAGLAMFALVLVLCGWLLVMRRYVILLLWPVVIYFCGPVLTSVFASAPALGQYIFPSDTLWETLVILIYFVGFIAVDLVFDVSAAIRTSVHAGFMRQLAASPMFTVVFVTAAITAIALQCALLAQFGTIFSGHYAYWADEGLAPVSYWGFLAGLYEIIFLCIVLLLLSNYRGTARFLYLAVYLATALLRVIGGTRLVLVKEIAFIVLLLYLERKIKWRQLVIATTVLVLAGTVVGLMRTGGAAGGFLGPLYGVAMESALNALSFNIAYEAYLHGGMSVVTQAGHAFVYSAVNAIPSFLRFGFDKADLSAIDPTLAALTAGVDTASPVGGMSGFATLVYVVGNPFVGVALLVPTLGMLLRWTPGSHLKHIAVLVFCLNAIHFWRDGLDISIKLVVQDVLCVLLFLYVPAVWGKTSETLPSHERFTPHASR